MGIYEAICMFAERQGVDRPMVFNTDTHKKEHFWWGRREFRQFSMTET